MSISKLLENNLLLKECVEALEIELLPDYESDKMSTIFTKIIPITKWGMVDWKRINKKIEVGYDEHLLIPVLEKLMGESFDTTVYIEWYSAGIPIIQANLKKIVECFDDVVCVDLRKFIFNPTAGYVIEVLSSGLITVGIIPGYGES